MHLLSLPEDIHAALKSGPLPLDRYMALCNAHYYATRDPLGTDGDFTTAPEISQLFGELLGLWAVAEWERLGKPKPFMLVEPGPGRGTLLADALRAARVRPAFLQAVQLHLVETSPALRRVQSDKLGEFGPAWHSDLSTLRAMPAIVIANEFFDALPVAQLTRTKAGWLQKAVMLNGKILVWGEIPIAPATIPADLHTAPLDAPIECSAAARTLMQQLCTHLGTHGGSAALIDYGDKVSPASLANGDTLQAVHKHRHADPLQNPGEHDLTCHVDFAPLLALAHAANLDCTFGTQADFLAMLGIGPRVAQLSIAHPEQEAPLNIARARLTDADQMGTLFKVLTVSSR